MDRFELNWPGVDAQLLTDGWRCRIVWRQRGRGHGGGMGGTIDNNAQCVRRLAASLEGSPYLLGALRSRGHDRLAGQIETAVDADPAPPARAERKPVTAAVAHTTAWLEALSGSDAWEAVSSRRAKTWIRIGQLGEETLLLKGPAPKGRAEWVVKRTWPDTPGRKAEYVAAAGFGGIARWLVAAGADDAFIECLLAATSELDDEALAAAAGVWRDVLEPTTH